MGSHWDYNQFFLGFSLYLFFKQVSNFIFQNFLFRNFSDFSNSHLVVTKTLCFFSVFHFSYRFNFSFSRNKFSFLNFLLISFVILKFSFFVFEEKIISFGISYLNKIPYFVYNRTSFIRFQANFIRRFHSNRTSLSQKFILIRAGFTQHRFICTRKGKIHFGVGYFCSCFS